MNDTDYKELTYAVWDSWGALYGEGYLYGKETIKKAVSAYNKLGSEKYYEHSNAPENRKYEALANLICQARYYGIDVRGHVPGVVERMVKVVKKLRFQSTTGGHIGGLIIALFYQLTSADYRWFFNLSNR